MAKGDCTNCGTTSVPPEGEMIIVECPRCGMLLEMRGKNSATSEPGTSGWLGAEELQKLMDEHATNVIQKWEEAQVKEPSDPEECDSIRRSVRSALLSRFPKHAFKLRGKRYQLNRNGDIEITLA